MTSPKYRLNPVKFRRNVLNAPWMVAEMRRRAEDAREFAVREAPDAPPLGEGYIASFEVKSGVNGGFNHDRAYATLRNKADHARYVEFGTERTDAHHILTRAMDVMGGDS